MFKQWRYRLEKGRPHLILLIALLLVIVGISVIGGFIVYLTGTTEGLGHAMWWTFLHVTDPGYLGDAEDPVTAVFGTIFTILGMITFMAGLVGILTSLIATGLKKLHEGGAPVSFDEHIVILGWNSRIFTLVADLLHASATNQIAILGPQAKEIADRQLERRVFDLIARRDGARAAHRARGSVVYRQGSAGVDHDLNRVSASKAKRFVLLAQQVEGAARAVDVAQIRSLYSIERLHQVHADSKHRFTTVVEFASEHFRSHAFYAVRMDPRLDAWVAYYEEQLAKRGDRSFLPVPKGLQTTTDMTAVNPDQIVSRVLVQCAVQPFISGVYDELFSFVGREMFLWKPDSHWKTAWDLMLKLPAQDRPAFVGNLLDEGIVIGSFRGKSFSFSPDDWAPLDTDVSYLVLGDKQSFSKKPATQIQYALYESNCDLHTTAAKPEYRVLVLGINRRFPMLMEQFADYVEQYPGSRVVIDALEQGDLPTLPEYPENVNLNLHQCDCTDWRVLGELIEQRESYDTVILLAEDLDIDDPEVDARVILVLVMLRAFRDDTNWEARLKDASLVAEVRDPRNRDILHQEQLAGDVIVGDGYVSGFLSQVCMDHRLEELYREILDFGHYEIYARKIEATQRSLAFGNLVQTCAAKNEIAIGLLKRQGDGDMTPLLAPNLNAAIEKGDQALVIASR